MSVVVVYQETAVGQLALREAAKEAHLRQTPLTVLHVPEGVDIDLLEATRTHLNDNIAAALQGNGYAEVSWNLEVITAEDAADAVLDLVTDSDAELIVVGARRRSRVGKLFMGSVTQRLIMGANVPVLVVKTPADDR